MAIDLAAQSSSKEVPPETWGAFPMSANSATMKQGGDHLDIVEDTYTPTDTGRVTGFISPGNLETGVVFPPGMEASATVSITVEEAALNLSGCPPATYEAGKIYTLTASVEGLRDPNVTTTWNATAGEITPSSSSVEGQTQAIWTAPNPAPSGIVTITATAETNICIPEGAPTLSDSCITRGNDYELLLSPEKACYDLGEVVTLTLRNTNDSSDTPETEFEVVTGTATVVDTGPNTAELTNNQDGEVGVVARLVSDPNQLLTATMTFGCSEGIGLGFLPANHGMHMLTFTEDDQSAYVLFGSFSASDGVIVAEFDAASTYQYYLAEDPDDPGPYGMVGTKPSASNPAVGVPIINTNLSISLDIPYTVTSCPGSPSTPGVECLEALGVNQNSVVIQGLSTDYVIKSAPMGSVTGNTFYTISLIPDNNSQ
jgi:hypothetical protein